MNIVGIKKLGFGHAAVILVLGLLTYLPSVVRADFGAYIQTASNHQRVKLSGYSWLIASQPVSTGTLNAIDFQNRKSAPEQGPAVLVISKPVNISIDGLSGHCGKDLTLPTVDLELPVWEKRFPTDDLYFQHYTLQQVTLVGCKHVDGALADILRLKFATIVKVGAPHRLDK